MPTFRNYLEEARSGLQEPSAKFFTDDEIMRWLNYALQLFAKETHILKGTCDYTWAASVQEVALSTVLNDDTIKRPVIEEARWKTGTSGETLLHVSMSEVWKFDPDRHAVDYAGTPNRLYYSPWSDKIGLYPTPSSEGTLTLFHSHELADYTALTQTVNAAFDPWWLDISAYAIARGKLKDVDHFSTQESVIENERFVGAMRKAKLQIYIRDFPQQTIGFVRDYPSLNHQGK